MGHGVRDHQPGSLYITIAVPPSSRKCDPYNPYPPVDYLSRLPEDFDPASYETCCADGNVREEFDWGLYWHRSCGSGIWYGLRRASPEIDRSATGMAGMSKGLGLDTGMDTDMGLGLGMGLGLDGMGLDGMGCGIMCPSSPSYTYTLTRHEMRESPRLQAHVVGLIRVLHVPGPIAHGLTSYLDWLAAHAAASATRSFIWATSLYLRTWRHVTACPPDGVDDGASSTGSSAGFDITGFLWESLEFAYGEVWYGLAGQLPRPIMASAFGVEVLLATATATAAAAAAAASKGGEDSKADELPAPPCAPGREKDRKRRHGASTQSSGAGIGSKDAVA